jgi:DNA end-binding protein Ku
VKPEELKLAQQVVGMFSGDLNIKEYRDEYKEELRRIIDAKVSGEEVVAAPVVEAPTNVVDLMAALRRSLDAVSAAKKPAAKADLGKKAPAKAEAKRKRA